MSGASPTTRARDRNLRWSPDGETLVFDSTMRVNTEIFSMNAACLDQPDSCQFERLTKHAAVDQNAAWSPDGTQLVFETIRNQFFDLFVMNADGSNVRQLTADLIGEYAPAWSPDGRWLIYSSNPSGLANLYLLDTQCVHQPGPCQSRLLLDHAGNDGNPNWSPDGRYLIFDSHIDQDYELFSAGDCLYRGPGPMQPPESHRQPGDGPFCDLVAVMLHRDFDTWTGLPCEDC